MVGRQTHVRADLGNLRLALIGRWLLERRLWLLSMLAVALALADAAKGYPMADAVLFGESGRRLLSSDWRSTFEDPAVQVGPVHVGVNGILHWAAEFMELRFQLLIAGFTYVALLGGAVGAYRLMLRTAARRPSPALELYLGAMVLVGGPATLAVMAGHLGEALIPVVWVIAAVQARSDRGEFSGLLIGLAAGIKLWGLLGLPLLLLSPTFRRALVGGTLASAVTGLLYAPFLLFGDVRMFHFEWRIADSSLLALWMGPGVPFGWELRLLQGGAVLFIGAGATLLARSRSVQSLWAVPLVLACTRLLLDPLAIDHYASPLSTLGLLGACFLASLGPIRFHVPLAASLYLLMYPAFLDFGSVFLLSVLIAGWVALWFPFEAGSADRAMQGA